MENLYVPTHNSYRLEGKGSDIIWWQLIGLGFYILVSLVYTEAPEFPVLAEIIQKVGDVGEAIVPGFCRYKTNSKTKSRGYLVFPCFGIPSI